MGKKNIYNINAMRQALINAHNAGNKKNLNRDFIEGMGIQGEYFTYWQQSVETLRTKVVAYVDLAWNQKFDSKITAEELKAAREEIYPAYKNILSQGEPDKETKKLRVDETDVERLIKFAWNFTSLSGATSMVHVDKKKFRLEVEKLMGCIITQAEMLSDSDRDKLQRYSKAEKAAEKAQSRLEAIAEEKKAVDKKIADKKAILDELGIDGKKQEELLKEYRNIRVALCNEEKALNERLADAKVTMSEVADDVAAIKTRLKYAGK